MTTRKQVAAKYWRWGLLWRSRNKLNGLVEYLIFKDFLPALFVTKREALVWADLNYGYIRTRPDLKSEPHGWMLPRAVKVGLVPLDACAKPRRKKKR